MVDVITPWVSVKQDGTSLSFLFDAIVGLGWGCLDLMSWFGLVGVGGMRGQHRDTLRGLVQGSFEGI